MDIELRYVDGCPNLSVLRRRLAAALDAIGCGDVEVRERMILDAGEAAAVGFAGSPTVLINGLDPFAETGMPAGLSCRRYRTGSGLQGSPSVEQLSAALGELFGRR